MRKAWHDFRIKIVVFLVFGALIIMLCLASNVFSKNVLGFSAWFAGAFVTAVLIGLAAWLSVLIRPDFYTHAVPHNKVFGALFKVSLKDRDPRVRAKKVEGRAELEELSYHHKHNKLDDIIFEPNL